MFRQHWGFCVFCASSGECSPVASTSASDFLPLRSALSDDDLASRYFSSFSRASFQYMFISIYFLIWTHLCGVTAVPFVNRQSWNISVWVAAPDASADRECGCVQLSTVPRRTSTRWVVLKASTAWEKMFYQMWNLLLFWWSIAPIAQSLTNYPLTSC